MFEGDYPFLDLMWTMLIFFLWATWFWFVITVFVDVFRRHDISGWRKAMWCVLLIVLPFIGVFAYMISQGEQMTQRAMERARSERAMYDGDAYGGTSPAAEIERATKLRDSGMIDAEEYETLKRKALT